MEHMQMFCKENSDSAYMRDGILTSALGLPEELPVVFLVAWNENSNVLWKSVFYSQPWAVILKKQIAEGNMEMELPEPVQGWKSSVCN